MDLDTDCIVSGYIRNGNRVIISGRTSTKLKLSQIQEFFRKAEGNTQPLNVIGDAQSGSDFTDEQVLTQYCLWTSDKARTGWYLLVKFDEIGSEGPSDYPFTLTLMWLGTKAYLMRGRYLYNFDVITNDWEP